MTRQLDEEDRESFEAVYRSEANQKIYERRKCRAELPFGHMKHNHNFRQFSLRGRDGVRAEFSLHCGNFNLTRILNHLGTGPALAFLRRCLQPQLGEI